MRLEALAPGYPWKAHFEAAGITPRSPKGDRVVIVSENTAFPKLAQVFQKTPVSVWRDYLTIQYLHQFADFLPKRIDDVKLGFSAGTRFEPWAQADVFADASVDFLIVRAGIHVNVTLLRLGLPTGVAVQPQP